MKLFEEKIWTDTEMDIIQQKLSDPLLVAYFRSLATHLAQDIATDAIPGKIPPVDLAIRLSYLQGQIDSLGQLVDIAKPLPLNQ